MKEIQGKIKFVAIPVNKNVEILNYGKANTTKSIEDFNFIWNKTTPDQLKTAVYLSHITEEQAAEFVRMMTFESDIIGGDQDCYENYLEDDCWYDTAKESLISLLKVNDVWIKKWLTEPRFYDKALSRQEVKDEFVRTIQELNSKPDDLLLIKL